MKDIYFFPYATFFFKATILKNQQNLRLTLNSGPETYWFRYICLSLVCQSVGLSASFNFASNFRMYVWKIQCSYLKV